MKKYLYLVFTVLLVFMVACGSENTSNDAGSSEGNEEEQAEVSEDDKSSAQKQAEWMEQQENADNQETQEFNEDTGKGYIEDLGYVETVGVGYSDELGIDGTDAPLQPVEMGSAQLEIEGLAILEVKPNEDAKQLFFDDKEKVKAIVVGMKAENTSDDDIEFHPNNSIMVTNTGEQVESDMFLMGDAGGEFLGKVKKEGQTWWILQDADEDISEVKMIISPPYTMDDWEDLAEEKRIEFEVLSWEEAQERDAK
ncbi:hypothetical protein [Oceanobacillus sp. Castelsardo]|uniref:hypothetical protein n=1 Tax=Oceanobacillus sp. Castelsardo TaxID=1851204 RepID=UPI0008388481|nr:hypothetical protein [Oceanobacillus sp. Castelsardo]